LAVQLIGHLGRGSMNIRLTGYPPAGIGIQSGGQFSKYVLTPFQLMRDEADIENRLKYKEPLAKVMSGNLLPHFGVFDSGRWPSGLAPRPCGRPNGLRPFYPSWIFEPWNHHANYPTCKPTARRDSAACFLKIHSKWDCILSTQTFASGSKV